MYLLEHMTFLYMYAGHHVPKDTVIFVNNHCLNMSSELWTEPEAYNPQRFLDSNSGEFKKPAHFQPFSMGKRACIGYKMVYNVAFSIISNLITHFELSDAICSPDSIPLGMLALPPEPFEFVLKSKCTPPTPSSPLKFTEVIKNNATSPRCRNVA